MSWLHQLLLLVLTVAIFLVEVVPLELQRRAVNDLVKHRDYHLVIILCAVYAGIIFVQGGTKLALNVYRGWVGERAKRDLRRRIRSVIIDKAQERGRTDASDPGNEPAGEHPGMGPAGAFRALGARSRLSRWRI